MDTYHANSLKSKEHSAEVQREVLDVPDEITVLEGQGLPEDIVKYDAKTGERDAVRDRRAWRQEF